MENILFYIVIILSILLIITIIYTIYQYNQSKYCETHENPNCPVYSCAPTSNNNNPNALTSGGKPAYRLIGNNTYECSGIGGLNQCLCAPGQTCKN